MVTSSHRLRVLFPRRHHTRFEANDAKLLSEFCDVVEAQCTLRNIPGLLRELCRCDVVYFWFPSDYKLAIAILARLSGKGVVVVGGGQMATADTHDGMEYAGIRYRPFYVTCARLCARLGHRVLAVSDYEKRGVARFVERSRLVTAFNVVDLGTFRPPAGASQRENKVVTVSALKKSYYSRKGLDTFVQAAASVGDAQFLIVGRDSGDGTRELIMRNAPDNLRCVGWLEDEDLVRTLQCASVYCQLSRQEGFGVALAEAMACGCVPVVSAMGAIPEVAGPDAFYIPKSRDPKRVAATIALALRAPDDLRNRYIERVCRLFAPTIRSQVLRRTVSEVGRRKSR